MARDYVTLGPGRADDEGDGGGGRDDDRDAVQNEPGKETHYQVRTRPVSTCTKSEAG